MAVFIGAIDKSFSNKSELKSELKRLYTLAWIADSKVEYESSTGRALNPRQKAASSRMIRKAIKLRDANKDLISESELLEIANNTYNKVSKSI